MRDQHRSRKGAWLRSKWMLSGIVLVLVLLIFSVVKEISRTYRINNEIDALKGEISQLESSNQEFAQFVEYLKTDVYLEEQARIKLGLKSEGEKLIVLQGDGSTAPSGTLDVTSTRTSISSESNVSKWFSYYWGKKS
jgi:cell division protein FtsB